MWQKNCRREVSILTYALCGFNKEHKKRVEGETADTNNFVLDQYGDFYSFTKLEPTIENNFSYLLGVILSYEKKNHSSIVATSEGP